MDTQVNTQSPVTSVTPVQVAVSNEVDANPIGTFRPYDSQLPITEPVGFRAVKCLYKRNMKTDKVAGTNAYVLVKDHLTTATLIDNMDRLSDYFISFLQGEEDKMIKERHLAIGGTTGAESKLAAASLLSVELIIDRLEASELGNRLNSEKVAAWFTESVEPSLEVAFAAKIVVNPNDPTDAEVTKLQLILDTYKAKFCSLASGKTVYRKEEAERLQKALEVATVDAGDTGSIGERFSMRLDKMINATTSDLLMSL